MNQMTTKIIQKIYVEYIWNQFKPVLDAIPHVCTDALKAVRDCAQMYVPVAREAVAEHQLDALQIAREVVQHLQWL